MSWPMVCIDDFVEKVATWNPLKSESQTPFPYIDLSSVDKDKKEIEFKSVSWVHPSEAPSRARQLVCAQDVLVAIVRPNLNGVALVTDEYDGATASTGYCVLRADQKNLDSKYLHYWVQTNVFINEMMELATGANYPAVSDKIIKESKIPLPPLAEQKRIAAILDKADAIRRKRQQVIQLADDFLRAVFLDMFGDPVTNPKGWDTTKLGGLVDNKRGISYGVVQRGAEFPGGVPIVRISNFVTNSFNPSSVVLTDPNIESKFRRTRLIGGEILISIRGTVGKVAIVPPSAKGWNVSREVAVIPLLPSVNRSMVHQLIQTCGAQNFLTGNIKGVAQSGINLSDLRELPVPLPPKDIIQQYSTIQARVKALQSNIYTKQNLTGVLFNSLTQRAFRGEL